MKALAIERSMPVPSRAAPKIIAQSTSSMVFIMPMMPEVETRSLRRALLVVNEVSDQSA